MAAALPIPEHLVLTFLKDISSKKTNELGMVSLVDQNLIQITRMMYICEQTCPEVSRRPKISLSPDQEREGRG